MKPARSHEEQLEERQFTLPVAPARDHADDRDADEWLDWFETLDEQVRIDRRDDLMIEGLEAGLTLQVMGDLFGVSREWVRQIAAARGVSTRDIKARKQEQARRHFERVSRHVYAASLAHPELTIEELAEWAETDEATVLKALGHRKAVHEVRFNDWSTRVSDEDLLEGLRRWAAETDTYTGDSFTEWATQHGLPSKQIPTIRFGGWNNALKKAGLHHLVSDRGGLRPVISDAQLWAGLLQFYRDDLQDYSAAGYDKYAREHRLGSLASVRTRLGPWAELKARIRQVMRYAAAPAYEWRWADEILAEAPDGPRNFLDEDRLLESLRSVASRLEGSISIQRYEDERRKGEASGHMIQTRLGSWVEAMVKAGLEDRLTAKGRNKLANRRLSDPRVSDV